MSLANQADIFDETHIGNNMRILSKSPNGKIILNPPNITVLMDQANFNGAAIVIIGRDIIVSTEFTDHNIMTDLAGFEVRNFDMKGGDVSIATFRGVINGKTNTASIDLWNQYEIADVEQHLESIQAAYNFLSSHRRLKHLDALKILIHDEDYVQTHIFDANGLRPDPHYRHVNPK